jgi:K+-transporting ATPase ATPase C chain
VVALTIITGLIYPFVMTGVAGVIFPYQAQGSIIERDGKVIGSALIGQEFTSDRYFHGRPSATVAPDPNDSTKTVPAPYNAANSGGSNLGPTNKALIERVQGDVDKLKQENPSAPVPIDLVTTTGSGLDPDISPAAALFQVPRVAKARNMPEDRVRQLVDEYARDVPSTLGDGNLTSGAQFALDPRRRAKPLGMPYMAGICLLMVDRNAILTGDRRLRPCSRPPGEKSADPAGSRFSSVPPGRRQDHGCCGRPAPKARFTISWSASWEHGAKRRRLCDGLRSSPSASNTGDSGSRRWTSTPLSPTCPDRACRRARPPTRPAVVILALPRYRGTAQSGIDVHHRQYSAHRGLNDVVAQITPSACARQCPARSPTGPTPSSSLICS